MKLSCASCKSFGNIYLPLDFFYYMSLLEHLADGTLGAHMCSDVVGTDMGQQLQEAEAIDQDEAVIVWSLLSFPSS